jgi:CHASE2 domain-containing sensor protein
MAGEAIIMLQARRAARVHCIRTRSCHNHATQRTSLSQASLDTREATQNWNRMRLTNWLPAWAVAAGVSCQYVRH